MRINIGPRESERFNRSTMLVVPVEPQPIRESDDLLGQPRWQWRIPATGEWCGGWRPEDFNRESHLPVRPGDVLDVAEPWRYDDTPEHYRVVALDDPCRVLYPDDENWGDVDKLVGQFSPLLTLHPASEMPAWAIRHHPRVVSVTAKRLRELTEDDAEACGFDPYNETVLPCETRTVRVSSALDELWNDWTSDHGAWEPEKWVYLIQIERPAT